MTIISKEVSQDVFPYLRVYSDGSIERYAGTEVCPPGFDPQSGVLSKDISISPHVSARLYLPHPHHRRHKLPLLVYFHGGAFCITSPAEPKYHQSLNHLVSQANVIAVSVGYRLAPEHPLPTAYEDSWTALQWIAAHSNEGNGSEAWIKDYADFNRVFLAGDSAGANIAHNLTLRVKKSDPGHNPKIQGIVLVHPYFWGKDPIGAEAKDTVRKSMVDNWWSFVCTSDEGCDDPYINPFVDGALGVEGLGCDRILVFVAENDILRDRGRLYYEKLMGSKWRGKAEIVETKDEDHVFYIFKSNSDNARSLIKRWASFINQE